MEFGLKPLGREKLWLWIMLAPTLIGLVFGAFGSILATLGLSFMHWDLLTPPTWAGASNYINLFKNPAYFKALTNTFKFSGLVCSRSGHRFAVRRRSDEPQDSWGFHFSHHLFPACGYLGGCHGPDLEPDLREGHRHPEFLPVTPRFACGLLAVHEKRHGVGGGG